MELALETNTKQRMNHNPIPMNSLCQMDGGQLMEKLLLKPKKPAKQYKDSDSVALESFRYCRHPQGETEGL